MCRGFLSGRVARDRRRTSFEGAKGRAKDSETATQRRDRKLLIKGEDLQRCESFLHAQIEGSRTCEGSVPVVRQAVNFFFYDLSYLGKRASSVRLC